VRTKLQDTATDPLASQHTHLCQIQEAVIFLSIPSLATVSAPIPTATPATATSTVACAAAAATSCCCLRHAVGLHQPLLAALLLCWHSGWLWYMGPRLKWAAWGCLTQIIAAAVEGGVYTWLCLQQHSSKSANPVTQQAQGIPG
jgi:hypothetical protein